MKKQMLILESGVHYATRPYWPLRMLLAVLAIGGWALCIVLALMLHEQALNFTDRESRLNDGWAELQRETRGRLKEAREHRDEARASCKDSPAEGFTASR